MFVAPPDQETELFTRVPDALRFKNRASEWVRIRRGGAPTDCFLEGPSFDRQGNLYVVDIAYGRILRISPAGEWTVTAEYDGAPNGLKIHKDGTIYIADHKWGIMKMDPATGKVEPHCVRSGFDSFLGVNDLFFAANGDLYFTDQGASDLREPNGRVFRLRAAGKLELILGGLASPNGLVMTPDEKALLLAVTRANCIVRLPLAPDGSLGKVGLFIQLSGSAGGGPDGLAIDEAGNLAIAHAYMKTVWLFNTFGEPILRIRSCAGLATTNIAFGGPDRKTLYITESQTGSILRCPMPAAGKPMYSHA
ncbi:MAG TPA: SMP-30/gluconolactonase/LRE family protein [Burkholderiales bacterium]|nr:SMP-30/gluconolactonase/LRE family protein [Burkholderiales bacterium]